jgi:hypothetical protein
MKSQIATSLKKISINRKNNCNAIAIHVQAKNAEGFLALPF